MNATIAVFALLLAPAAPPSALRAPLPLDIVSDTDCPAASDIGDRLRQLFPEELFGAFSERVHVARGPGLIKVELARADGTPVVERTLPATDGCARLAEAVAVVVVTWESELHPELLAIPRPPPAPAPAPERAPASAQPAVAPPAGPQPPVATAYPSNPSRIGGLVMAGALGSLVGTGVSAGARAAVVVARAGARFAVQTDVWAAGQRALSLGDGHVRWWRVGAALGPSFRIQRDHWALMGALQLACGLVSASGSGYDVDRTERSVLPGAASGVTVIVGSSALFAWGAVRALVWPWEPRVRSVNLDDAQAPPVNRSLGWWEVDAAVGLGVRF